MTPQHTTQSSSPAVAAGVAELQDLLQRMNAAACADREGALDFPDCAGTRDYPALASMVLASVNANLTHQNLAHREGYLRAAADLLSMVADDCSPGDRWDPLRNTAAAFDAPAHIRTVVERMRSPAAN